MENPPALPENTADVVKNLLQNAITLDGGIDGRSSLGRSLKAVRQVLKQDGHQAAIELLEQQVTMITVLCQTLQIVALSDPQRFIENGRLSNLLTKDVFQLHEQQRKGLKFLLELKQKKASNGGGSSLDDIFDGDD